MSLTYAKNTFQLVNWGVSVGDVAVLSGAGRGIITWLTAPHRDKSLLDFLSTVPTELGMRKGLVDPESLNRRWGRELSIFHDGQRQDHTPVGTNVYVENLDRFTWTMVIIVVCLDQMVSNHSLEGIILELCAKIFMDKVHETEFLQHEIPLHIQGWRSIGCVRKMTTRAASSWECMERDGHHLPGFIPDTDSTEVVRLLEWITIGTGSTLITTSSDVFSLAMLLKEMGIESLRTGLIDSTFDESALAVKFDVSAIPPSEEGAQPRRSGMRIPLEALSGTISLWPGTADQNNRRRYVFSLGQRAAAGLQFHAAAGPPAEPWNIMQPNRNISIAIAPTSSAKVGRLDPNVYALASKYLFLVTPEATRELTELVKSWRLPEGRAVDEIVRMAVYRKLPNKLFTSSTETAEPGFASTTRTDAKSKRDQHVSSVLHEMEIVGEAQIFVLGYFYTALQSIMDISQMSMKEGFGSWGWYDSTFMEVVRDILERGTHYADGGKQWTRHVFFQLVGLLYTGAELDNVLQTNLDTVGILGKLAVLSPGLLGNADTPERICKFHLLDIDPTAIPSSNSGIVTCSIKQPERRMQMPFDAIEIPQTLADCPTVEADDFTSHIEPAWGYDTSCCTVAFRHLGRLVHKVDTIEAEIAVLSNWSGKIRLDGAVQSTTSPVIEPTGETLPALELLGSGWKNAKMFKTSFHEYYGSNVVKPQNFGNPFDARTLHTGIALLSRVDEVPERMVVFVPSQKMRRARLCISSLYTRSLALGSMGGSVDSAIEKVRKFPWRRYSEEAIAIPTSEGEGVVVIL